MTTPHPLDDLQLALSQLDTGELWACERFLEGACQGFDRAENNRDIAMPLSHILGALRDACYGRRAELEGQRFAKNLTDTDLDADEP